MSFINASLPRRIAAGLRIGPEWRTEIVPMDNGREVRDAKWLYPRWRASGNMGAFEAADRAAFRGIFVAARGKWAAFRVLDPLDCVASGEPLAPTPGSTAPVQLTKTYDFGPAAVTLRIQAPVAGSVTVYADGSPVAGVLDSDTGLFTPTNPWSGTAFTWSGQFERWMRFDSDWGALNADAMNAFTADIELIEVRR